MTVHRDETIRNHAAFIRSIADLLRGDYKQSEYGRVILPMVVLRRLDCVLDPTKTAVLDAATKLAGMEKSDEFIIERIKRGKPGTMPAFGKAFSDSQIAAIVAYIRLLDQ